MPTYTAEEIQTVVEKLVLSTIRRPYDTLGTRRADLSFNDVQQAAAGVFILYPAAAPYVLFLGSRRLGDLIVAEATLLDQLIEALKATDRNVLPVEDVSTLFNAQAALQELARASVQQKGGLGDVTKTPSFVRFSDNTQRFLDGPGQNVRAAGQVVQTPQEARSNIPGLVSKLREAHALLVSRVQGISGGLEDYNNVDLPVLVSASVLANAAKLMGEDAEKLDALTPVDRLALVRQTVLNVLAARSVVVTFGSSVVSGDFFPLNGLGVPYSDAAHPATPASVLAGSGSFGVELGVNDGLSFTLDDETTFDLVLQPSVMAELDGILTDEQFVIGDGVDPASPTTPAPNNNVLRVQIGSTIYPVTLPNSSASLPAIAAGTGDTTTSGWYGGGGTLDGKTFQLSVDGTFAYSVTFTAPANEAGLLSQINAVTSVGQHAVVATAPGHRLTLTTASAGPGASILLSVGTANSVLGFTAGQTAVGAQQPWTADYLAAVIASALPPEASALGYYFPLKYSGAIDITTGTDPVWSIPLGATDLVALGVKVGDTVHVPSGADAGFWPILAVTTTTIQVQGTFTARIGAPCEIGPKNRAIRILCIDPASQLPIEETLTVVGDDDVSKAAARTLGFTIGATAQCLRTTMAGLVQDLASKTQALSFAVKDTFSLQGMRAKTNPANPLQVSLVPTEVTGGQEFTGTTLTFTASEITVSQVVSVGDTLVLLSGPNALQSYVVTTINGGTDGKLLVAGDVLEATGSQTGSSATDVTASLGPTLTLEKYQVLLIESGPNNGRYTVAGPGDTPLDILLTQALPAFGSGPVPLELSVSYGTSSIQFISKTKTVQSHLQISGDFTGSLDAFGTTPWLRLPGIPRGLTPQDRLEVYAGDYKTPSSVHAINIVDPALKLIGVAPELPSETSRQFTPQPPPFARLRRGTLNDYAEVKMKLDAWLARDVNQEAYFTNLNRLINPLLANKNPTAVQAGDAVHEVQRLYAYLRAVQATAAGVSAEQALDSILATFVVSPVQPVDTLLKTYREKGSDRATDLLLQGAFSVFFDLTVDGASYSGAFQEAARAVARNDLPIRRFNREETQRSRLIAKTESPDMEYSANSVSETAVPDAPTPFGEPANYGRK